MATYYALPSMTNWNTVGGWSNTSGGPSNGNYPVVGSDVIFDANSGAARSIVAGPCSSINTTGAAAMTFTSTLSVTALANNACNLTGTASVATLTLAKSSSIDPTITTLTASGVSIGQLNVGNTVSLASDIVVTGSVVLQDVYYSDGVTNAPFDLNCNNKNVTLGKLTNPWAAGSNATVRVLMGTGTWTFTGTGTLYDGTSFTTSSSPGCTVQVTDTSATSKTLDSYASGTAGNTSLQITGTGTGGVFLAGGSYSSLTVAAGSVVSFPGSGGFTAGSFAFNGVFGNGITVKSASAGFKTTLTKTGGGAAYMDYCSIKDINGSPASTFIARASTDLGNNSNITFFKALPNFAAFF
jgi:hypothetical protein